MKTALVLLLTLALASSAFAGNSVACYKDDDNYGPTNHTEICAFSDGAAKTTEIAGDSVFSRWYTSKEWTAEKARVSGLRNSDSCKAVRDELYEISKGPGPSSSAYLVVEQKEPKACGRYRVSR